MTGEARDAGRPRVRRAAAEAHAADGERAKPLRPSQCREYMRRELAREFRGIVQGFVEGAKAGSCQHVKLATELMEAPKGKARRPRGKGSVQLLLERLERENG